VHDISGAAFVGDDAYAIDDKGNVWRLPALTAP
jgi:hypothetical protein